MTAIEQAIKDAVEKGGYKPKHQAQFQIGNDYRIQLQDAVFLDPSFWLALGKARGWRQFDYHTDKPRKGWLPKWHRFIDHLAEGKDVESFFANL